MLESDALAAAEKVVRKRFDGDTQFLRISKLDRDSSSRLVEERWQAGNAVLSETEHQGLIDSLQSSAFRPVWVASYLVYSVEFKDGLAAASVTIDDESGESVLHVSSVGKTRCQKNPGRGSGVAGSRGRGVAGSEGESGSDQVSSL